MRRPIVAIDSPTFIPVAPARLRKCPQSGLLQQLTRSANFPSFNRASAVLSLAIPLVYYILRLRYYMVRTHMRLDAAGPSG
jgi:hypothetical protein